MREAHYVYSIDDPVTGEFYYGVRSCQGRPEEDCYMGSYKSWTPEDTDRLKKYIIRSDFNTREDANSYEEVIIELHIDHPLNRNYHIPYDGFCMYGAIRDPRSEEWKRAQSERMKGENSPTAKLTWKKVTEIRSLYAAGDYTLQQLANTYRVDYSVIGKIVNNKIWVDRKYKRDLPDRRTKVNQEKVKEIRRLRRTGDYTYQELADKYGVSVTTIFDTVNNKRWIELED